MLKGIHIFLLSSIVSFMLLNPVFAQPNRPGMGGKITGIIFDEGDQNPIEYAYIILYSDADSSQVSGTVSDADGRFLLNGIKPGKYYLEINYMGFENYTHSNLQINRNNRRVDLEDIHLQEALRSTEDIEVVAEKAAVTYLIDRKVINVSQQQTTLSGTATDVLENIPSVTVDIEGNVSLRGSSSFVVLLDGIPTILEPSEVLEQIPASAIEDIEIITNPSAKYDPDGTSGIINIITKKDKLEGLAGIVNVNVGMHEEYGADFLLNYRVNGFNFYVGGDYSQRNRPGSREEENWTTYQDTTSYTNSSGDSKHGGNRYSVKAGFDYSVTKKDMVSLGLRYGGRSHERSSVQDYETWSNVEPEHINYLNESSSERSGDFYSATLDYRHNFAQKGHEITAQLNLRQRDSDEESITELYDSNNDIYSALKTTEAGPSSPIRMKLDYVHPLNKDTKFEAGYQSRLGESKDKTNRFGYDFDSSKYVLDSNYSTDVSYNRDIHAIYGIYASKLSSFGYQAGLRTEYTQRDFSLTGQDSIFKLERWDFFPTLHMSYSFSEKAQMMVSYTRRIERPRGYNFEPFITWMDAFNVRRGNPDLKPEYIDSYEMGYSNYFGKTMFSLEAYYRVVNNSIERVRSVYSNKVTLHTFANAGASKTFGSEVMVNTDFFKVWNVNLMGNLYQYKIEGEYDGKEFSRESFNWSARFNNTVNVGKTTRFQMNASYNSPTVTSQGRSEDFMMLNLGLRQDFLNRTLSATLQVRDLLQTAKHEFISEGDDFYSRAKFTRDAPVVSLTLTYRIHGYKEKRSQRSEDNGNGEEDF